MATMGTRKLSGKQGASPPVPVAAEPPVDLTPRGTGSLRAGSGLHGWPERLRAFVTLRMLVAVSQPKGSSEKPIARPSRAKTHSLGLASPHASMAGCTPPTM